MCERILSTQSELFTLTAVGLFPDYKICNLIAVLRCERIAVCPLLPAVTCTHFFSLFHAHAAYLNAQPFHASQDNCLKRIFKKKNRNGSEKQRKLKAFNWNMLVWNIMNGLPMNLDNEVEKKSFSHGSNKSSNNISLLFTCWNVNLAIFYLQKAHFSIIPWAFYHVHLTSFQNFVF